ncbi:MAG: sel1 repeat family protein, partial [Archangium sp.]|nr:sel1 repeat family protein [Archangium sp.]
MRVLLLLLLSLPALAAEPCAAAKDAKYACEKKPAECIKAGDALIAIGGCRDAALARYQSACDGKELRGCSKLAFRLVEDTRDKVVVARAITLFTKACDGGDALGCSNLASFYWDGEGV